MQKAAVATTVKSKKKKKKNKEKKSRKKHWQMKVRVNKKAETIASRRNQRRQLVSFTVCGQQTGFVKEITAKKRGAE